MEGHTQPTPGRPKFHTKHNESFPDSIQKEFIPKPLPNQQRPCALCKPLWGRFLVPGGDAKGYLEHLGWTPTAHAKMAVCDMLVSLFKPIIISHFLNRSLCSTQRHLREGLACPAQMLKGTLYIWIIHVAKHLLADCANLH